MTIGAEGGSISLDGVTLEIPAGAVEETVNIKITRVDSPVNSNFDNAGVFYRIGPDNQQFLKDLTLTMEYQPHLLTDEMDESEVKIWTAKEFTFSWQALDSTLDKQNLKVSTQTSHFSLFGPAIAKIAEDGDQDEDQEAEITGEPEIYVEQLFDFGPVEINTVKKAEISISNRGDTTLIIEQSSFSDQSDAGFSITNPGRISIEPNFKQGIEISFSPQELKEYSATLEISSNDPDSETTSVTVMGTGVEP